jgi:hypothetical protein
MWPRRPRNEYPNLPVLKLDIIRNWKAPESEDELRRFLGVCTFWRRFVKDFAKIAVPLHNLFKKRGILMDE